MSKRSIFAPLVALVLSLAVALSACGPSVDGEKKDWERSNTNVTTLTSEFPTFKAALETQQATAKKAWVAAATAKGDEEKAKQMKAANETIGKLTNRVGEVKSKRAGLESTITKLGKLKLGKEESKKRSEAMEKAREAVTEVNAAMAAAAPTDEATAMEALEPIISKLISADGAASRALSKYKKGKKKKK